MNIFDLKSENKITAFFQKFLVVTGIVAIFYLIYRLIENAAGNNSRNTQK